MSPSNSVPTTPVDATSSIAINSIDQTPSTNVDVETVAEAATVITRDDNDDPESSPSHTSNASPGVETRLLPRIDTPVGDTTNVSTSQVEQAGIARSTGTDGGAATARPAQIGQGSMIPVMG
ncbi:hypothetical protein Cantr_05561 [Candida viswanathii]|uniref:Uncharacterized protein n=1 Tax=Candida viswanathii TaxID=5486 RepID=A0A367XPZ8_9ASCO|nr:hypothetical protein Cantr_05561 [Candida viswanathii]